MTDCHFLKENENNLIIIRFYVYIFIFIFYFSAFQLKKVNPREKCEISQGHYSSSKPLSTIPVSVTLDSLFQYLPASPIFLFNSNFYRPPGRNPFRPRLRQFSPLLKLNSFLTLCFRKKETILLKVWFLPANKIKWL